MIADRSGGAVLERIRHGSAVEYFRRSLRGKAMRAVQDAITPLHQEHRDEMQRLREEVDRLRDELGGVGRDLRTETQRGIDFAGGVELRSRRDIFAAAERRAAESSADFVAEHMTSAILLPNPPETLRHALSLAPSGGLALEFGVYTGTTLGIVAEARSDGRVFGFDSFKGLPENWRAGFPEGTFGMDELPEVNGAELVIGWFDEVLPGFLADHEEPVDFLHVDCDLYSSTKTVLDLVGPRLRVGSIVLFDEYFNYQGWQQGEYLAWREYVERTGTGFRYESYTVDNEQVAIRITEV